MPQFKESQASTNRSLSGFLSKQVRIHSFTPEINNNTQVKNTSTIPKISYLSITNFEVKKETNNNLPFSSIQPFLWNHTRTESGAARSRGVRTPLKITAGGNLLPSVVTASVTVKLLFLAPQDFTGMVLLPPNSRILLNGSSNRMGVSSILKILDSK